MAVAVDAGVGRTPDGTGAIPGCMGIANVAGDAVDGGGALPGMFATGGLGGGAGAPAGGTVGLLLVMAGLAEFDEVAAGFLPIAASSSCIAFDGSFGMAKREKRRGRERERERGNDDGSHKQ